MNKPVIGFAGLTHLGLNSAVASAARGFSVVGYHNDEALASQLTAGEPLIAEPDLTEMMATHASRLSFAADASSLAVCDLVYIAVDVPTDAAGKSDLAPIYTMIDTVFGAVDSHTLIVILCQVPPGFTRSLSLPENRLYYQVETLIFGRAIERAIYPERFILGCARPEHPIDSRLQAYLSAFDCPILPMRYESAELAKISINFCLVASISVANTLAEISEEIGADWEEIAPALKLDRRIGPYAYLKPGLGISGGNLERDLRTVIDIGKAHQTDTGIIEAWLTNSKYRKDWLWQTLHHQVLLEQPNAQIAVLGLAYKENTHSTKNSPALQLISHLTKHNVRVHDPVVPGEIVSFAEEASNALSCVKDADVLVIATPWPEYRDLTPSTLSKLMRGRVLIDPYRLIDGFAAMAAGFAWHALGVPPLYPVGDSPC